MIDLWKKTKRQYKYAFLSTILFGILSQGMGLFNKFSVSDDINYFFNGGDPLPFGRWMLYILRKSEKLFYGDGLFSLPLINGLLSIICIGVSVCLLIDLFDLQSEYLCVLLGGAAVSVPCVICFRPIFDFEIQELVPYCDRYRVDGMLNGDLSGLYSCDAFGIFDRHDKNDCRSGKKRTKNNSI